MSQNNNPKNSGGFTLVEVLIIGPFALLIIAGFIALMTTMIGDVMVSHGRNNMTHDVQASLDMIERDVRLSTQFLNTTNAMLTPQGKDGVTSAFTSIGGDLILGTIATDKNIIDPTRSLVYYNTPNGCADPLQIYKNQIFFTTVMYFVQNGSLWRRTFVPAPTGTLCAQPWQVNTCAPGFTAASTQCATNDTEVMKNVQDFNVTYYADGASTTDLGDANALNASTINVQINGRQTVAGRTLNATASLRSTKLSDKDIRLLPPTAPTVSSSYDPAEPGIAIFSWAFNPLLNYTVRYNINGGAWVTATENTVQNTIKLAGARGNTITAQVSARNTTGSSGFGTATSRTLPAWNNASVQAPWVNYDEGGPLEVPSGFTKTTSGIVFLRGRVTVPGTPAAVTTPVTLFTLPPGYRPSARLMFAGVVNDPGGNNGLPGRIDVLANGEVRLMSGNTAGVSLNDIYFVPAGAFYDPYDMTFQGNWQNYSGFAPFQAFQDAIGRIHLQGLVEPSPSFTAGTVSILPASSTIIGSPRPTHHLHLPAFRHSRKRIDINGTVGVPDFSSSYYTMQTMYHPNMSTGWSTMTPQNGWTNYGGSNTTLQYIRSSDCVVSLKGLVSHTSTLTQTVVGTLPSGYRPPYEMSFNGATSTGNYTVRINEIGTVYMFDPDSTWTSLDGINFMAGDGTCPAN